MTTKDYREKSPLLIFLNYFKNHKKSKYSFVALATDVISLYNIEKYLWR